KDVAGKALDGEVLVHCADEQVLRLQQHFVVGVVRDSAARSDCRQPSAAARTQDLIDGVMMDERTAPSAPGGETFGKHSDDGGKILSLELAIRPGALYKREELVLTPFAVGNFGHD